MRGCADIIITVRPDGSRGGSDVCAWLECKTFWMNEAGRWTVQAVCGCFATQAHWWRCVDHARLEQLYIQTRLPFDIAES